MAYTFTWTYDPVKDTWIYASENPINPVQAKQLIAKLGKSSRTTSIEAVKDSVLRYIKSQSRGHDPNDFSFKGNVLHFKSTPVHTVTLADTCSSCLASKIFARIKTI